MDRRHRPLFPNAMIKAVASAVLVLCAAACGSDADERVADAAGTTAGVESATTTTVTTTAAPEITETEPAGDSSEFFPDVLAAEATQVDDGTWTFSVTLSSPYDSPEQYADAWRIVSPDGTELGFRLLTHDHASEQPFTRSQSGISVPESVMTVTIEGRDQANGWGGTTLEFEMPGR